MGYYDPVGHYALPGHARNCAACTTSRSPTRPFPRSCAPVADVEAVVAPVGVVKKPFTQVQEARQDLIARDGYRGIAAACEEELQHRERLVHVAPLLSRVRQPELQHRLPHRQCACLSGQGAVHGYRPQMSQRLAGGAHALKKTEASCGVTSR